MALPNDESLRGRSLAPDMPHTSVPQVCGLAVGCGLKHELKGWTTPPA